MTGTGYIYLLRDANDRPYYIGQTVDTQRREREHRASGKLHASGRLDVIETVERSRIDDRERADRGIPHARYPARKRRLRWGRACRPACAGSRDVRTRSESAEHRCVA